MMVEKSALRKQVPGRKRPPGLTNGVIAGGSLYLSAIRGQGDDIQAQAHDALQQMKTLLEGAGASMDHVAFVTVYFRDVGQRPSFDEVWVQYFPEDNPPARTGVQVAESAAEPGGKALFALDVIAVAP